MEQSFPKQGEKFKKIKAVAVILLIAVIFECTLFNIRHWATRFETPVANAQQFDITFDNAAYQPLSYEPLQQIDIDGRIEFIVDYLDSLTAENILAVISVKDTASNEFTDTMADKFYQIGLSENLQGMFRIAYGAILVGGEVVFEQLGTDISEVITYDTIIEDISVSLLSAGFDALNTSGIQINGVEYSLDRRGLNIVLFDMETRQVIDSVSFDMHSGLRMRRMVLYPAKNFLYQPTDANAEISVSEINERIRTVYIRPYFGDSTIRTIDIGLRFQDENVIRTQNIQLINGYSPSFYIVLGSMGNVDNLTIILRNEHIGIQEIVFNVPLPWSFQLLRVFLFTFAVSIVYFWKKYKFSDIPFDTEMKWQKILDWAVLATSVALLIFIMIFSVSFNFIPGRTGNFSWEYLDTSRRWSHHTINQRQAEAILMGQLHLDIEPSEGLLNATFPQSPAYRNIHNIAASPWDHVFFNGRIYSYFGIVPVLILFLPFYLITGIPLAPIVATFIFSVAGYVAILFLWRELVVKFTKNIPYPIYLTGLITALFGTNFIILLQNFHYGTAAAGGLTFSIWGFYFILYAVRAESFDEIKTKYLCFGGLCMALAVGCRPTMLLSSLLVPFILFPTIYSAFPLNVTLQNIEARKKILINILALMIPYVLIGSGLAWYNFSRFGSVTEFGTTYQLTAESMSMMTQSGILGNIRRAFDGIFSYLLTPFNLNPRFPFITPIASPLVFTGHTHNHPVIGAFMMPITWFLPAIFFIGKKDSVKNALHIIAGMFILSIILVLAASVLIGMIPRYVADFYWLILLTALLFSGLLHDEVKKLSEPASVVARRLILIASGLTCFILFGWGIGLSGVGGISYNHPVIIRFLADMFFIF